MEPPSELPNFGPSAAAPGWYPDPGGVSSARWWDGTRWTEHVWGPVQNVARVLPEPPLKLGEQLRTWYLVWMAMAAANLIAYVILGRIYRDFFDQFFEAFSSRGPVDDQFVTFDASAMIAGFVTQIAGLVMFAVLILQAVWLHGATRYAAAAGLPAVGQPPRRTPVLAALSYFIPIVNFWWPYQSICDVVPIDHPVRPTVLRWWLFYLATTLAVTVVLVLSVLSIIAGVISAALGAAVVVASGLQFRTMMAMINESMSMPSARDGGLS